MFPDDLQRCEFSTQTIDLSDLSAREFSDTGSFYVRVPVGKDEFAKLFQALPIPLLLLDREGVIVYLNDSCFKISRNFESFVGQSFADLFYRGSARKEIRKVIEAVFETRKVKKVKTTLGMGRRGVLWVRFHFRPLKMSGQRLLFILVEDLTSEKIQLLLNRKYQESLREEIVQRIKAEQAIRRSEWKYRHLFVKAPVGIVSLDGEGRILFANPKAGEILGLEADDLSNRLFLSFVHEDDRRKVSKMNQQIVASEVNQTPQVCRIMGQGDTVKWAQINSVNTEWDGSPATLKFIEDISKKRELEDEFLKMQKLDSLGWLAGGIAHDFNNILTAILGNLSSGVSSLEAVSQTLSYLSKAQRACVRAKGLTHQLLTFAKGGAPVKKICALDGIIRDSCEFASRGSNVSCRILISDNLHPADVDPVQISQVLNNLAMNANQAMPGGGSVSVHAENMHISQTNGLPLKPGEYVRIRVSDNGEGISDDVLPYIFDPYFTTKDVGSGLGLATAYSIVKNHGGAISVTSKPGKGSMFSVYLPASQHSPEPVLPLEDTPGPGTGRVLVMDDEEPVRDLLKDALEQFGYEVAAVKNGEEALALYAASLNTAKTFSAVILDLTVPGGMGGLEAARKIRELDASAKLIISSGQSQK